MVAAWMRAETGVGPSVNVQKYIQMIQSYSLILYRQPFDRKGWQRRSLVLFVPFPRTRTKSALSFRCGSMPPGIKTTIFYVVFGTVHLKRTIKWRNSHFEKPLFGEVLYFWGKSYKLVEPQPKIMSFGAAWFPKFSFTCHKREIPCVSRQMNFQSLRDCL